MTLIDVNECIPQPLTHPEEILLPTAKMDGYFPASIIQYNNKNLLLKATESVNMTHFKTRYPFRMCVING